MEIRFIVLRSRLSSGFVDSSLKHLLTQHPDILVLRIRRSSCTDEGLQNILCLGQNLSHIQLERSKVTGDGLRTPGQSDKRLHLKELALGSNPGLTDSGLKNIASYIQTDMLETLDLSSCIKISETGFISLLKCVGGGLKSLNMSKLRFSLSEVVNLTTYLSNLEDLDISGCYIIGENSFISLINIVGDRLKKLNMSDLDISLSEIGSSTQLYQTWRILICLIVTILEKLVSYPFSTLLVKSPRG